MQAKLRKSEDEQDVEAFFGTLLRLVSGHDNTVRANGRPGSKSQPQIAAGRPNFI